MAKQFLCSLDAPIVETVSGKVRGFQVDGTYTFHGIPYAKASGSRCLNLSLPGRIGGCMTPIPTASCALCLTGKRLGGDLCSSPLLAQR